MIAVTETKTVDPGSAWFSMDSVRHGHLCTITRGRQGCLPNGDVALAGGRRGVTWDRASDREVPSHSAGSGGRRAGTSAERGDGEAPVGVDLRLMLTALRVRLQLERCAELARHIAERAGFCRPVSRRCRGVVRRDGTRWHEDVGKASAAWEQRDPQVAAVLDAAMTSSMGLAVKPPSAARIAPRTAKSTSSGRPATPKPCAVEVGRSRRHRGRRRSARDGYKTAAVNGGVCVLRADGASSEVGMRTGLCGRPGSSSARRVPVGVVRLV